MEGKAKKSLGQNFLVSREAAGKIVAALEPGSGIPVFEIGPGRGALTLPLAEAGARIAAFEIDSALAAALRDECLVYEGVEIIEADIREIDFDTEAARRGWDSYRIAGNIPYLLTSTILLKAGLAKNCAGAVIMMQKEVGERILSSPGERECGILSVFMRAYLDIGKVAVVKAGSFVPRPKIDSVVLSFIPAEREGAPADREAFFQMVKKGFSQRRKKISNVLGDRGAARGATPEGGGGNDGAGRGTRPADPFSAAGVDRGKRPEQLLLEEWFRLFRAFGGI